MYTLRTCPEQTVSNRRHQGRRGHRWTQHPLTLSLPLSQLSLPLSLIPLGKRIRASPLGGILLILLIRVLQIEPIGDNYTHCCCRYLVVWLFWDPIVAHQAPPSMGFSRQEYWNGLPFPSPEDLPDPGVEAASPALQVDSLSLSHLGSPVYVHAVLCLVTQSCPTLCDPLDCSLPGSSVHGDSSGKNTGVGCHTLLQGVFPTQALNPGLLHCRRILYCLSHKGSPYMYIHMHKEIYYKNLNCVIMETDKSGEPQLAGWRPRRTDAVVPAWVQRPEN